MSFARDLVERGDYEEAIEAATKALAEGDATPEPLFDRARAYELLERYPEALDDFEAAIRKNLASKEMSPFELDDAYFSTVVAAARAVPAAEGVTLLARYRAFVAAHATDGAHVRESLEWAARLEGRMPSLLDKTKDADAI